jgi:hypothetical protein
MKKHLIILSLFYIGTLAAQAPLSIPTKNHCAFSGTEWEEDIYQFATNPQVQTWINEILQSGGAPQNFIVIQASVENVAAVVDPVTGKRYLLYSQNFIEHAKSKLEVYAALAHEIGHHLNEHKLTDERRVFEELEADQFMGFVLGKTKGIGSLEQARKIVDVLPSSYSALINAEIRREAIKNGWIKAEKSISIKSAGFDNDPQKEEFLKAQFQVLPCCSPLEMPKELFAKSQTLGEIAQKLILALDKQGYYYRSFKSFKGGFALITQMEQFNNDYTFRNDKNRWSGAAVGETFKGFMDYFKTLVFPQKSNFRTFVFVVTEQGFTTKEGVNVSKDEAESWYRTGFNKLPKSIAATKIMGELSVTALVYEFQVPETNKRAKQNCPTIDTKRHLVQSKIWESF